ncbi:hypothetical protein CEXT_98561 [Caerostris extrusa]|uniref:Uncharacterized protein n=1 Tax=Caerostris extrusa TaxID=172846 RepID=A0AAV4XK81_CAEEX|nr:hypothetical protein CEXT_98561 [Caerostris extrusa]
MTNLPFELTQFNGAGMTKTIGEFRCFEVTMPTRQLQWSESQASSSTTPRASMGNPLRKGFVCLKAYFEWLVLYTGLEMLNELRKIKICK